MKRETRATGRVESLDQFRGYTVLGMFLVNFVGGFAATHWVLKHHNTFCSYADTIMPQFFFAVGFAFRLTMIRRVEHLGAATAYWRVARRLLGLVLLSLVIYTADRPAKDWSALVELGFWGAIREPLKSDWFQTLMHIAVTSFWVLPVILASARVRVLFLLVSVAIHAVLSQAFYFAWVNNGKPNGIDGGPLGFLTWTVPVLVGSLCTDAFLGERRWPRTWVLAGWASALIALGYVLSCGTRFYDVQPPQRGAGEVPKIAASPVIPDEQAGQRMRAAGTAHDWARLLAEPPLVPPPHSPGRLDESYRYRQWNYWMMSQRGGTISYLVFASGLSVALLLVFHVACDRWGWSWGIFRTLGTNALAGYLLHMPVADAVQRFMPADVPSWYLWTGCGVYLLITYLLLRGLERAGIFLRV